MKRELTEAQKQSIAKFWFQSHRCECLHTMTKDAGVICIKCGTPTK